MADLRQLAGTGSTEWVSANFPVGQTASAGLPVSGDSVQIPATARLSLAGSTLDRTIAHAPDPIDDSSASSVDAFGLDLAALTILAGCQINIGTAAAPLKCLIRNGSGTGAILHNGSGTLCFSSSKAGGNFTTDILKIASPNGNNALDLAGAVTVASVELLSGGCTHRVTPVTLLRISPSGLAPCLWRTESGSSQPATIHMGGGTVDVYASGGTILMSGGQLTIRCPGDAAGPVLTQFSGYTRWNAWTAGTNPDVWLYGGTLDFRPLGASLQTNPRIGNLYRKRSALLLGTYTVTGTERFIGE